MSDTRIVDGVTFEHDGMDWISQREKGTRVKVVPVYDDVHLVGFTGFGMVDAATAIEIGPHIAAGGKLAEQLNQEARNAQA